MKQLLDRAALIGSLLVPIAGAATVVHLLALGFVCRFSLVSHCDLSDYVRLSVLWLAPLAIVAVFVTLLSLALDEKWWLIVYCSIGVIIALAGLFSPTRPVPAATIRSGTVLVVTVLVLISVCVLASFALRRSEPAQRKIVLALSYAALAVIIAFYSGILAGLDVMAARQPTIAVHLSGEPTILNGVQLAQLHDALVLRVLPVGKIYSIPQVRIQLIEQLP